MDVPDLLRRLDDPEHLEAPADYNSAEFAASFAELVHGLNEGFDTECVSEQDTQDSGEYGRVEVPAEATVCGTRIVVAVSKFGSLALIAADNPGAFLGTADAEAAGELDAGDEARVEAVLTGLGYVVVPEELLTARYHGPSDLRWHGSGPASWWDRFFGSF